MNNAESGNNVIPDEDFAKAISECRKDPYMDALFTNAPQGAKLFIGLLFYTQYFGENIDEEQYQAAFMDVETSLTPNDIAYLLRSDIDNETKNYLRGILEQKEVMDITVAKSVKLKPVQLQRTRETPLADCTRHTEYEQMVAAETRRRRVDMLLAFLKNVVLIGIVATVGYGAWMVFKDESPLEPDKLEKDTAKQTATSTPTTVPSFTSTNTQRRATTQAAKGTPKLDFNAIKNSVVVIGNDGTEGGTAFILKMEGKKYLVTNDHVAQMTDHFRRVYLLDGTPITLGTFEVAKDRDMVRFEVDDSLPALALDESVPEMGEKIVIYGNSMGRGAVTEEKGSIKAIGPMRLEVDAKVVPGNSGSPVLDMAGKVIGILTYGTNDADEKDWNTKNTRYADVRRWAVRFVGVRWEKVEWKGYVKQTELMNDMRNFRARLDPFIAVRQEDTKANRSSYGLRYDELTKRMFQTEDKRLRIHLIGLSQMNGEWDKARREFKQVLDNRNSSESDVEDRRKKYQKATFNFDSEIYQSLVTILEEVTNTVWVSFDLRETGIAVASRIEQEMEIWQAVMRDNEDEQKEIKEAVEKNSSVNDKETPTYHKCKNAIAILRGARRLASGETEIISGTGFLCKIGEKKYLVTNRHVIDNSIFMQVYFQNGKTFKLPRFTIVDIAANRDMARFDLSTIKGLPKFNDDDLLDIALDEDTPNIGDAIEFYGNSEGENVVTVTVGKVLAVGHDEIEINAKIQGGNSGSPLVRVSDGKVIGVTTRSKFNEIGKDLSKVGTRYDPKVSLTREFAVRFTGVKWESIGYDAVVRGAKVREEVRRHLQLVHEFCFDLKFCLDRDLPDHKFGACPELKGILRNLAKTDGELRESRDRFEKMRLRNGEISRHGRGEGALGSYSRLDFENQIAMIRTRTRACFKARLDMLYSTEILIGKVLWKEEESFYKHLINRMLRDYQDKFRYQLQGSNLPDIPSVPANAKGTKGRSRF